MKFKLAILPLCLAWALPTAALASGKFAWFDETPARDSLGLLRTPRALLGEDTRVSFGVDAYRSQANPAYAASEGLGLDSSLRLYGEVGIKPDVLYAPLANLNRVSGQTPTLVDADSSRLAGFGVKWQHRVDAANTFSVSAGYSESAWALPQSQTLGVLDTRAALSWSSMGAGTLRPGLTGSVFVGDETPRDEAYQRLGRRYYGFSVGGQVTLFEEHTPYLSFRTRRPMDQSFEDSVMLLPADEDRSLLSAGWRWQVQPNWSLQAEASYGLNGATLDPYGPERSRFFFGTRFDFR